MIASNIYLKEISLQVKDWSNNDMELSEIRRRRLAQIIDTRFKGIASDLAAAIGRDSSYVSRIFTEKLEHRRNLGEGLARDIEALLGLAEHSLDDASLLDEAHGGSTPGIAYDNIAPIRPISKQAMVPVISWVTAGSWCEAVDNFSVGDAEMWLPCPIPCSARTYALRVVGDSMTSPYPNEKSYPEGVIIFVDPDKNYENGSRVIAKVPETNEVTFKKLVMDSGRMYLKPLNPAYPTMDITRELHVCGVVIASFSIE
jgi:SOS-response transcriptional repressor LexA